MKQSPFKWSAVVPIAVVFAVLAAVEFLYFPGKSREAHERALSAKATAVTELTAYSTAPALEFDDKDAFAEHVKGAARDEELRYLVAFAPDGQTYFTFDRANVDERSLPRAAERTTTTMVGDHLHVADTPRLRASRDARRWVFDSKHRGAEPAERAGRADDRVLHLRARTDGRALEWPSHAEGRESAPREPRGEKARRGSEPGQERVLGEHEPRAPHTHEWRARHGRAAAHDPARPTAASLRRGDPSLWTEPPLDHQRHPRLFEDRGREAHAGSNVVRSPDTGRRRRGEPLGSGSRQGGRARLPIGPGGAVDRARRPSAHPADPRQSRCGEAVPRTGSRGQRGQSAGAPRDLGLPGVRDGDCRQWSSRRRGTDGRAPIHSGADGLPDARDGRLRSRGAGLSSQPIHPEHDDLRPSPSAAAWPHRANPEIQALSRHPLRVSLGDVPDTRLRTLLRRGLAVLAGPDPPEPAALRAAIRKVEQAIDALWRDVA